jgi:MGT family glycosyltransferase
MPPVFEQIFGFVQGLGPRMVDDLLAQGAAWQPDLIVRDPVEYGGYVAAEVLGIPHASIMWAIYIDPRHILPELLDGLRMRHGLPSDPTLASYDRFLVLKFLPPSWQIPMPAEPAVTHCFSAPPFDMSSDDALPTWVDALPDRPTVYATLGTTFNKAPGIFRAIIDALSRLPVNGIITVGKAMDPAQFGTLPANVYVEKYIPQTLLLSRCDAMIFHGGYNSFHSAMWHGLPVVAVPLEAGDQVPTAEQLAAMGLGVMVKEQPPTAQAIAAAVEHILCDEAYRARGTAFGAELRSLPPLEIAVARLEQLARDHAPQK